MIDISNLYAGYDKTNILKDISFSLDYGQNLSLLGSNGCGKTTLIRCISSLIPFEGTIKIDNINTKTMKRSELASKIAVMGQMTNIYFPYTVYETVMMGRYQKLKNKTNIKNSFFNIFNSVSPSKKDTSYVEHCLEITGLKDIKERQITTLSGGQLQRVFLAHTLAQEPNIILLDEPTNHLDLKHQVELISYLKEWGEQENHCVIGVFHDINLALNLSKNVIFIKDGEIISKGNFYEIASTNLLKDVYDMDVVKYMTDLSYRWSKTTF